MKNSNENDNYYFANIDKLFKIAVDKKASDLHLSIGAPPHIRIHGALKTLNFPILKENHLKQLIYPILTDQQISYLERNLELDFAYEIKNLSRFRGSIIYARGYLSANFRIIPHVIPDLKTLGLPEEVKELCELSQGLILVTGATGSGKSTTLASMIDYINRKRNLNIITLEDPIEFIHNHNQSLVSQREIGSDTHSFSAALRHILRHDPDVILIGEMRDLDSISIALSAAETGHLVFSTLHTQTAPLTINRIIDVFDGSKRSFIRQQLSNSLQAIISQKLIAKADNEGRLLAVEYLKNTLAVKNMIRENQEHQLYSVLQTNQSLGMQTMDQSLIKLYNKGLITLETLLKNSIDTNHITKNISATQII